MSKSKAERFGFVGHRVEDVLGLPIRVSNETYGPDDISSRWELITGPLAQKYLDLNIENNRKKMVITVSRYATDKIGGNWVTTHEGMAFDIDGFMVDGQHRLSAIIKACEKDEDYQEWVLVTRGLSKQSVQMINRGRVRTLANALQVAGFQFTDTRIIAAARIMYSCVSTFASRMESNPTDAMLKQFMTDHTEAIMFANQIFPKGHGPTVILAALARAYYHVGTDQLIKFVNCYIDKVEEGDATPCDAMVRRIARSFDAGQINSHGGMIARMSAYKKVQHILYNYLHGNALQTIRESDQDHFPLPEEKK